MNYGRKAVVIGRRTVPPKPGESEIAVVWRKWVYPAEPSRLFATVAPLFTPDPPDAFTGQAANP